MVIRVLPPRVPTIWPFIKWGLLDMKPLLSSGDDQFTTGILKGLLCGEKQLWIAHTEGNLNGFAITYPVAVASGGASYLYLYALYSFGNISEEDFEIGVEAINEYAKNQGCFAVRAEVPISGGLTKSLEDALGFKRLWVTIGRDVE